MEYIIQKYESKNMMNEKRVKNDENILGEWLN